MQDWLDATWMVTSDEPEVAYPEEGRGLPKLLLGFGFEREDGKTNCNERRDDDVMCRLWKDHEGPHIPFSRQLVTVTDVYVLGMEH